MKKIPSIFVRDWKGDKSRVTDECNPETLWVFNGEGVATRKYDGTAVLVEDGVLYCRYDAKNGKTPPEGFRPAQEPDIETGHWPGWVPAGSNPQYKWQIAYHIAHLSENGTYEACGPHFQSNPENLERDLFIPHGCTRFEDDVPRTFNELVEWFKGRDIEGIVWHHPDGRMAKIKKSDFGLRRKE
jgi:hypothetical protein